MQFKSKKFLSLTASIAVTMSTLALPTFSFTEKVLAAPNVTSTRLYGNDRYETAIRVSQAGWKTSEYAVIATGENFPDALCAGPLAQKYKAPILLTCTSCLDTNVKAELQRLKVSKVFIVGGTVAVSDDVEKELKSMNITIERLAGLNRYETSKKIADKFGSNNEIVVTTGEDFPDALSISNIAASKGLPILLTYSNYLSNEIRPYINYASTATTYVIGGTRAISNNVYSLLKNPVRLGGIDRYDTNVQILNYFKKDLKLSNTYVATGEDFPDALTCSALASQTSSPLLLLCEDTQSSTIGYINENYSSMNKITVVGGTGVLSESLIQNVRNNFGKNIVVGNTAGNINNLGLLAYQNNVVYSSDGKAIYKKASNDSQFEKIADCNAICLNVTGNYIFFLKCTGQNTYKICRMNTDGTNITCLNQNDNASNLIYYNNYLYYISNTDLGQIFRINTDGAEKARVASDLNCKYLNVNDDYVYYSKASLLFDGGPVNRLTINGTNKTQISDNKCAYSIINNGYIYYINSVDSNKLYSMKIDGSSNKKLTNDACGCLNIGGSTLYYSNKSDGNKLYSINIDGSNRTKVNDTATKNINIANGSILSTPLK